MFFERCVQKSIIEETLLKICQILRKNFLYALMGLENFNFANCGGFVVDFPEEISDFEKYDKVCCIARMRRMLT